MISFVVTRAISVAKMRP